jgi:hypothetical protein
MGIVLFGVLVMSAGVVVTTTMAAPCPDPNFSCFNDTATDTIWVTKNTGVLYGPSCTEVCSTALCGSGVFHSCAADRPAFNISNFAPVANAFGFGCKKGGCWNGVSGSGQIWVSRDTDTSGATPTKNCYFPNDGKPVSCSNTPGNANCYGERYSTICPCHVKPLETSCSWKSPPNHAATSSWGNYLNGTSCLDRINYWRRKACEDGWKECPPCGLPPMVECTACHECANSEADYDKVNGAHASFTRCGERVQGEGGGATCAAVIDAFVSERNAGNGWTWYVCVGASFVSANPS